MKVRKAVIPVAGLGLRFLPATKAVPKEMLPIVDKPTIQYIVEEARASGIETILFVTGGQKKAVQDHFDRSTELERHLLEKGSRDLLEMVKQIGEMIQVHTVLQKTPRGLGHAVLCAREFVGNEPFAVLLGDDLVKGEIPCLKQLMDVYSHTGGSVLAVQEVALAEVSKYGIIDPETAGAGLYRIKDMVEKPQPESSPSRLAVMGRYIINPGIFEILARTGPGSGGEIQLTDGLRELCRQEEIYGLAFSGKRYDVGDKLGYLKANVEYALDRAELSREFAAYLQNLVKEIKDGDKQDAD
jgi:UTP--glucose-1-phosphate uridylyltransferase